MLQPAVSSLSPSTPNLMSQVYSLSSAAWLMRFFCAGCSCSNARVYKFSRQLGGLMSAVVRADEQSRPSSTQAARQPHLQCTGSDASMFTAVCIRLHRYRLCGTTPRNRSEAGLPSEHLASNHLSLIVWVIVVPLKTDDRQWQRPWLLQRSQLPRCHALQWIQTNRAFSGHQPHAITVRSVLELTGVGGSAPALFITSSENMTEVDHNPPSSVMG